MWPGLAMSHYVRSCIGSVNHIVLSNIQDICTTERPISIFSNLYQFGFFFAFQCVLSDSECPEFGGGRGFAPDPAEELTTFAPADPVAGFKGHRKICGEDSAWKGMGRVCEFNAQWRFKFIQSHVFWRQWKGDKAVSNTI